MTDGHRFRLGHSMAHPSNVVTLPRRATAKRPRNAREAELRARVLVDFKRGIRRLGWTLEQTARECGATTSAVIKWLSGRRRIPATAYAVVMGMVTANDNAGERRVA